MLPHKSHNLLFLIYLCLLAISACMKSNSSSSNTTTSTVIDNNQTPSATPVGTPVGNPTSKMIGAAGGIIFSSDSVLELTIPAGALSANTNISIQPVTSEMPGGIGLGYDLQPSGTKFSIPATISFHYTGDEVSDNFPYFLDIAYQDSNQVWKGDIEQCYYDTVAKTVSTDISHFTIFEFNDGIAMHAKPTTIYAGQSSSLNIDESLVIQQKQNYVTKSSPLSDKIIGDWKVNGITNGNSSVGTVIGSGVNAIYHAPANLDQPITVFVSAVLKITETFVRGKTKTTIKNPQRGVLITVKPYAEYDFTIKLYYYDSTISTFYGQATSGSLPVYSDHAQFDVHIKAKPTYPELTLASGVQNFPPGISSSTYTYENSTFTWLADPVGIMDVSDAKLSSLPEFPDDSVLEVSLTHANASNYGRLVVTFGVVTVSDAPLPFPSKIGIPGVFLLDLKKTPPYLSIQLAAGGRRLVVAVLPKQ
jgi:hypothetical protein